VETASAVNRDEEDDIVTEVDIRLVMMINRLMMKLNRSMSEVSTSLEHVIVQHCTSRYTNE